MSFKSCLSKYCVFFLLLFGAAGAQEIELTGHFAEDELPIAMKPGVAGFGIVLDLDEHPIAGAQVVLRPSTHERAPWQQEGADDAYEGTTHTDGRFDVEALVPGTYSLTASAPGYSDLSVPGIEVIATETFDLGTVLLDRGHRLAGRVTNPQGWPIVGAEVSWRRLDEAPDDPLAEGLPQITNNEGTFLLEGLPSRGGLALEVWSEGFQFHRQRDVRSEQGSLDIVLEPGVTLRGEVVDVVGRPVEDVAVELFGKERRMVSKSTDGDGSFEFAGLAPGEVLVKTHSEAGYTPPRKLILQASESPFSIRLELQTGAVVSGWVLDPEGAAVPGSTVELQRNRPGALETGLGGKSDIWSVDAAGRYTISNLAAGHYRLTIHHPDFVPVSAVLEVDGEDSYPMDLEFSQRKVRRSLEGRVVDGDQRGVQGAAVTLFPVAGGEIAQVVSRADGRFEVNAAGLEEHFIEVRHPHFASYRSEILSLGSEPTEEFLVELASGGLISGSIEGLEPEQLAGLKILASSRGLAEEGQVTYDGSYRLAGLAVGEWRVRALAGTRTASGVAMLVEPGETVTLDLHFAPGFQVRGDVRFDGEPLPGAQINALCLASGFRDTASTNSSGQFEFRDVPEGRCTLTIADTPRGAYAERQVEVRGETEVAIDLTSAAVSGQVLSLEGLGPLVGATVELLSEDALDPRSRVTTHTDPNGRFTLAASREGTCKLRVSKEGFALSERQVALDARQDLRLFLQPAEDVVLYIRGIQGDVPGRVGIEVHSTAGAGASLSWTYQPNLNGKVMLRSLPPGFWRVHVTGQGAVGEVELEVPGEPVLIVLGAAD